MRLAARRERCFASRRRILPILALSLLGVATALAAAGPEVAAQSGTPARIASIDVDLSFEPDTGLILEEARLEIAGSNVALLELDLNPWLVVEHVWVDQGIVEHRMAGDAVELFFSPRLNGTRKLRLRVSGKPLRGGEQLVTDERVILAGRDRWYPTLPGSWANASVSIRVPDGWTAVGPGQPVSRGAGGVWSWRADKPVRSLGVVAAPGLILTEGTAVQTRVHVAAPAPVPTAERIDAALSTPMAWFSANLAPYLFDGFNLVMLPGLPHRLQASGMIAVPADTALTGPADGADLLAGQWFGERLAGDGIWMESFAAWSATDFARRRGLGVPAEIAQARERYFALSSRKDAALSSADETTDPAVVRGKGSAAPDMIRLVVGDTRFYEAIGELFESPPGSVFTLDRLRAVFEQHAGATLLRTFSDWFDRQGAPELAAKLRSEATGNGNWRADLTLEQVQGNYALPVEAVFVGRTAQLRKTVYVDGEMTSVHEELPFEPIRIEIDPLDKLFMKRAE